MDMTHPILYDIQHFNWVKAAFVASFRAIFGSDYVPYQYRFVDDEEQTKILIYTAFPYRSFKTPCIVIDASSSDVSVSFLGPQERVRRVLADTFREVIIKSETDHDPLTLNQKPLVFEQVREVKVTNYTQFRLERSAQGTALIVWTGPNRPLPNTPFETQITLAEPIPYLYFTGILRLGIKIYIYASTVTDAEKLTDLIVVFLRFFLRDKLAELKITYSSIDVSGIDTVNWNDELLYRVTVSISNCHSEYELLFPESLLEFVKSINLNQVEPRIR